MLFFSKLIVFVLPLTVERFSLAEELLESVKHLAKNMTSANDLMGLQQAINDVVEKVADLQSHVVSVNDRLTTARLLTNTNQQQMKAVKVFFCYISYILTIMPIV